MEEYQLETLYRTRRPFSDEERALIARAYDFSMAAHEGQTRKSGEPYFGHCFEAARITTFWGLDAAVVAAALLHDIVEDTPRTLAEIKQEFGAETASLVDGVTKLGHFKFRERKDEWLDEHERAENFRKMIFALSDDLRVIFIKLADRLHNMRTLGSLPPEKQKRVALETEEVYASLAYRLGMARVAGELEDLALPYLHPADYAWLLAHVPEQLDEREAYLKGVVLELEASLRENGVPLPHIDFRAKRYSSLYKKLIRYDMDISQIYDLVAVRVIVANVEDCYKTLGLIHQLWPPLPGRFKDYIALPKPNGYQSLHTTVFCVDGRITEFQVRTIEMHEAAEYGIAAHWAYEKDKDTKSYRRRRPVFADGKDVRWVQQLRAWQEAYDTKRGGFMDSLKVDFFSDRIYVVTPKGDVIDLPQGATPIDFAYQIHSEVGDEAVGARVNGGIATLDRTLKTGDLIEILRQKGKKPSENWLEFVKTSLARDRIRDALKKRDLLDRFGLKRKK